MVATVRDVEMVAMSLPHAVKELRDDDRPAYLVNHKLFCFHRTQRKDALDHVTGERLDDVIVFRVANEEMKAMWLAARPEVFFTTDHFNGHASILTRVAFLGAIDVDELFEVVSDAWLACAPKRMAAQWIAGAG